MLTVLRCCGRAFRLWMCSIDVCVLSPCKQTSRCAATSRPVCFVDYCADCAALLCCVASSTAAPTSTQMLGARYKQLCILSEGRRSRSPGLVKHVSTIDIILVLICCSSVELYEYVRKRATCSTAVCSASMDAPWRVTAYCAAGPSRCTQNSARVPGTVRVYGPCALPQQKISLSYHIIVGKYSGCVNEYSSKSL